MQIERRFSSLDAGAYGDIAFVTRLIAQGPEAEDGEGDPVIVPAHFSQVAAEVMARSFCHAGGVPAILKPVPEDGVPEFLWRHEADLSALQDLPADQRFGPETDARQVFDRMAGAWTYWGWKGGYFDGPEDARAYLDEMRAMLARQMASPSPEQWQGTGLHWAYGIATGEPGFRVDPATGLAARADASPYVTAVLAPAGGRVVLDVDALAALGVHRTAVVASRAGPGGASFFDPDALVDAVAAEVAAAALRV